MSAGIKQRRTTGRCPPNATNIIDAIVQLRSNHNITQMI